MSRIRIPADLNEEDVFLSWGPIKMSIRQMATVLGTVFGWFGVAKYLFAPMFGLAMWAALIASMWILGVGFAIAFVKIRNRPLDTFIGEKVAYHFSARTYIARENPAAEDNDEDLDLMLQHVERPRVVR